MKQTTIPVLTASVGIIITLLLVGAGATAPQGEQKLPLLMLLFASELGFLVTLGGAIFGIKLWQQQREKRFMLFGALAGFALSAGLLVLGLTLWFTTTTG